MSNFWKNKRVLVTGGAGFLGSHVVERLRNVDCLDIFIVCHQDYDLTGEDDVRRMFREHPSDVVIHLAGLVGGIGANKSWPADFFYQNLMMGILTVHHAWKSGVDKVICAGAGCGYPETAPIPLQEECFWNGFPQPDSAPYSLAKRMLHVQSLAYWKQYQFPVVVVIPGNIYGPFDNFDLENAHVIPALVRKFVEAVDEGKSNVALWGSGSPTRDFVYAGDVAEGMLRAGEIYTEPALVNLSSGTEHSIREVAEMLSEIVGFKGEVKWDINQPEGQSRRLFNISKAERDLGYRAHTSLREGLRLTAEWYQQNRQEARNTLTLTASAKNAY